ncbi:MAG: hypothetical protein U0V70_13925 [Terriglobia bacterium]
MPLKTPVVLIAAMVAQVSGNLLLSKGMRQVLPPSTLEISAWLRLFVHLVETPSVLWGAILLIVFFCLFAALLSWADLSFVLPASSFGYVLNVAMAHHFLGEPVSLARWIGTTLISIGVILVSITGSPAGKGGADNLTSGEKQPL